MLKRSPLPQVHILSLKSEKLILESGGGKGANLARLIQSGFNVPEGFVIPTWEYQAFTAENQLQEKIRKLLSGNTSFNQESLEDVSVKIRRLFTSGKFPEALAADIKAAYWSLGKGPVAVRSSATTEDLPEASFAGQQDSFLNVIDEDSLLKAIVECWGSLWTARAIGYRTRNHLLQSTCAIAVVVQQMVESQVSGVMFTANPLTGLRTETVIDATLGLGEALVSGLVEPDHFVVDHVKDRIISKVLGSKKVKFSSLKNGGTRSFENKETITQCLPDEKILELSRLGQKAAEYFSAPQDLEWAFADGELFLLQSRPITTLFPLPSGIPAEPLKVLFSFAAIQGMFAPMTQLGMDTLRSVFAMGASLFDIRVTEQTQTVLFEAGQRLWVNFTPILKNSFGRKIISVVLDMVEPTIRQAVEEIWDDPRLQPGKPGISWHARGQIARFLLPLALNVLMNLAAPQSRRKAIIRNGEAILRLMETRSTAIQGSRGQKLIRRVALLPYLSNEKLPHTFILFVSGVAAGMASWNLLWNIALKSSADDTSQKDSRINDLMMNITRGMPYNPTTEMDLALWQIAKTIQSDPASLKLFLGASAQELNRLFHNNSVPGEASRQISSFLEKYGGRGLGEIDLGSSRWSENAEHVFEMILSYLNIKDSEHAPDAIFSRSADSARDAIAQLVRRISKTRHGWLKAGIAGFFAGRARQLMGMRESPKFFAVRMFWIVHRELLKSGQEYVKAGELEKPDDLFYLTLAELKEFASGDKKDWRTMIASRREVFLREQRRRQIPRLLLSDGRAFYEGMREKSDTPDGISGSPVSPGSAEGRVRVVLDPRTANLQQGEIMVCLGTDPSWTPLFLAAGGLVMETGGMMTHGAVVAREYGIPAIVGVDKATQRLKTGQVIRMDGSSGRIQILEQDNTSIKEL